MNDHDSKVAYSLARKPLITGDSEDTLISVVLRGGGYGAEWANNFLVEDNRLYHQGFNDAADKVLAGLMSYLQDLIYEGKIKGSIKLLITGYSRSAAVA